MVPAKLDLTKEYKVYYTVRTTPDIVKFDEGCFLTIEGKDACMHLRRKLQPSHSPTLTADLTTLDSELQMNELTNGQKTLFLTTGTEPRHRYLTI